MSKQKIIISSAAAVAVSALLITGAVQCIKVNREYPAPEVTAVEMSQELLIGNGSQAVTATGFDLKEIDELSPDHSIPFDYKADSKIALVELTVKNVSDKPETLDMTTPVLTAKGWENGLLLELFLELNPGYDSEIAPGESIEVVAPYAMLDYQFKSENWDKIMDEDFSIVFQVYPEKKYISLHR